MAKIALLIGVSNYDSQDLKPLPAAARDVAAMQEVLQNPDLGEFDRVTVLPDPDLGQIQDAINSLFDDCQTDDLVLLYFSGHGITDEAGNFFFTNRTTRKTKQGRLNKGSATPASFVHDLMEHCESDRLVIVLDCCHSGAFPTGMTARDAGMIDFSRQLGGKGRIILTSSAATEYSFERQGDELAVYTRYLVEGIKTGAADLDRDGAISVNELHDYVRERVRKAAPAMKPERYVFQEGEKILLAKAPVSDPKLQFRQDVQKYSGDGIIRYAGRSVLEKRRKALKLTSEDAATIIAEVLRPYEEHRENLKEYEQVLQAEMEFEFPLGERTLLELQALQRELNLTDENVAAIRQRLAPQSSPSSSPPATRPSFSFDIITVNHRGQETNRQPGQAGYFTEDLGNGVTLEIVKIPGGRFLMGTADSDRKKIIQEYVKGGVSQSDAETYVGRETPQHEVTVQSFWMGKYAVTQAQYAAIIDGTNPAKFKGAQRPVEQVSWDDAIAFCTQLSQKTGKLYRLPSEAEWEYACRAETTTPFHFGETITPDLANYNGNYTYGEAPKGTYREQTSDVGSFPANAFGLYDMHGNVWEWCADQWYGSYANKPESLKQNGAIAWTTENTKVSPKPDEAELRLLRGGSWYVNPWLCRSAYRYGCRRDLRGNGIGFRLVCAVPSTL